MTSDEIIEQIRTTERADFVAKSAHPFLVITQRNQDSDDGSGFQTLVSDPVSARRRSSMSRRIEVYEVKKAPSNPYRDRISVGRARNCDVVLRDGSVSKLHAHFRPGDGGAWEVVDLGSQNGTCKNGTPLAAHRSEKVEIGDLILFGSVEAKLVDAALLYDFLK
jgi:hypothetical protein